MLKWGTAGVLVYLKWQKNLRLGLYFVKNAKIRYGKGTARVLYCPKSKNKVWLEFSSIGNAEVRYCWEFISLKMLKQGMARDFFIFNNIRPSIRPYTKNIRPYFSIFNRTKPQQYLISAFSIEITPAASYF